MIPFFGAQRENTFITDTYRSELLKIINSGQSVKGKHTIKLANRFKILHDYSCLLINSATDGLYFALKTLQSKKVAVPAISYKATYNSILRAGATPVVLDVDSECMINYMEFERADVDTVITVSLFGKIKSAIYDIAKKRNIKIIEDAAQSDFGYSFYLKENKPDISILSFDPTKILNCFGTGGAILFREDWSYQSALKYKSEFHNSNISEINAWVVDKKITHHLESWKKRRENIAEKYKEINTLHLHDPNQLHALSKYVLRIPERDNFLIFMMNKGIECKVHYDYSFDNLPMANILKKELVSLPIHPFLSPKEISLIILNANEFLDKCST